MSIVTYNNRSIANISAIPGAAKSLTHIKTLTASSSSTLSFVDGSDDVVLDSTYPIYVFKFINIHPSAQSSFRVGFRDGDTDYDATKTTTNFNAQHNEADSSTNLGYEGSYDQANATGFLTLDQEGVGTDNDASLSGKLHLFNPSSTTFVKHFTSVVSNHDTTSPGYSQAIYVGGYCNVTAAIDGVQFTMSSGNIAAGTIKMYGVV